jgi:hypothetical protein
MLVDGRGEYRQAIDAERLAQVCAGVVPYRSSISSTLDALRERRSVPLLAAALCSTEISRRFDCRLSAVSITESRSMTNRGTAGWTRR